MSVASSIPEFVPFPKIARLHRDVFVTEKIDGTNALVHISDDGTVRAGSRTRWITPEDDNFGFARWVADHVDDLRTMGPGSHFGEWWGSGIQRGYGLTNGEKRFSLFNTHRWSDNAQDPPRPKCCHVVPLLAWGNGVAMIDSLTARAMECLRERGSMAAPGFLKPEGIVIYHSASGQNFKVTLERDSEWKGKAKS